MIFLLRLLHNQLSKVDVYEFHECIWHRCYKPDYVNHKTAANLYSKTIERSLAIRNAGYNLIEMWECDFVN